MQAEIFETPLILNMGFHYTRQFSRRTRVRVMGLVDQGSEAWNRWYLRMHEAEAAREIAAAGYTAIEIHFLYGFGLEGEREEWECAVRMTRHAHAAGLKVFGYLQFHSVQQELFFPENPWARDCVQIDAEGRRIQYTYDRPALCFTDPRVRQYYLDAVTLGLRTCDLDGIRLDNDYYKGCYCPRCQAAFQDWLHATFDAVRARRLFGFERLDGLSLAPKPIPRDPLWRATVLFRQQQRQDMMRALRDQILAVKPQAILGGNPAVSRRYNDPTRIHVHVPDLAETHHLVCAENPRFPARTGESTRHQVMLYKYGQSGRFAVFASHHLLVEGSERTRWPESIQECALSLCEALAFGGHPVCTTWGLRMDGAEERTLYQRPLFLRALAPVAAFVRAQADLYRGAVCSAAVGICQNRESLAFDAPNAWLSLQGAVQVCLQHQIPFRFVDRNEDAAFEGLQVAVVPDLQQVSDAMIARLHAFAKRGGRILVTGDSFRYDEWGLPREAGALDAFWQHPNVTRLSGTPEKTVFATEQDFRATVGEEGNVPTTRNLPLPPEHAAFAAAVRTCLAREAVRVEGSPFVAIDTFATPAGVQIAHLLNYNNTNPCDLTVTIDGPATGVECLMPEGLGTRTPPRIEASADHTTVRIERLHTYAVLRYRRT